jgi:putative peptidoglycan lipid II flippase
MALGMTATAVISAFTVGRWGACGIAAANMAGITLTAALLLRGLGRHTVAVRVRRIVTELAKPVRAAVGAAGVGLLCARPFTSPPAALAAGCLSVTAVYLLLAWVLDAAGARSLGLAACLTVRWSFTRKNDHGR